MSAPKEHPASSLLVSLVAVVWISIIALPILAKANVIDTSLANTAGLLIVAIGLPLTVTLGVWIVKRKTS